VIKHRSSDNVGDREPTALQDHCTRFIGRYKKPTRISFTSEPLPVSAANKVLRREVAKIITAEISTGGED
jgi:acyl-coenzyme A synthetase/AMP-(fatty) acid ligase